MMHRRVWLTGSSLLAGLIIVAAPARGTEALTGGPSPEIKMEIQYAEALQKMGMADYAEIVIDRLSKKHPEAKPFIKVLKMQSMIARGKFEDVLKTIAKEPNQNGQDAWAMRLSLADGYYAWGKYAKAEEIYKSFFKAFSKPSAALNDFYVNSAYKYAQMLLLLGKEEEAVKAYENVLKADVAAHIKRQVMSESAELMLKVAQLKGEKERGPLLDKIGKLTDDILWVQDIWFGKAIVIKAHLMSIKGDISGAEKLIEDYKGALKEIDEILREQELEQLSPMAQCRYLLGEMMWKEAEKLLENKGEKGAIVDLLAGKKKPNGKRAPGALQHFLNVFIGYPSTKWAPEAGEMAEKVEQILKDRYGAKIKTQVTQEQMDSVRRYQFQGARALFNQNQFKNAVDAYLKVLNRFPEGDTSVAALGELARCYVETEDDLMVDVTVRYMGERFGGDHALQNKAGDQVLRAGGTYGDRGNAERKTAVYETYFNHFPKHPMAAALLYQSATRAFTEEKYTEALPLFERIVNDYAESPSYMNALRQITYCHLKLEDAKAELLSLKTYTEALAKERQPGHEYIRAKFRMATGYQNLGDKFLPAAIKRYGELAKLIELKDPKYSLEADDTEKNNDILQGCLFFKGVCYTRLKKPAKKIKAYQVAAIKTFQALVAGHPKSRYAPAALSQVGTLWTILEKPDEAQKALKQLQSDYPGTPEADNALFMLGKSLLELGMRKRAVAVFREMFSSGGKYSNTQILTAGNELLKAGEYDISLQAFDRVLSSTEERAFVEKAMMGKGQVMVEREEFGKAVEVLQGLMDKYPKSGMTVEASLQLSRSYSELAKSESDGDKRLDLFNKAVLAMTTARQYDKSSGFRARSDVVIANLLLQKGQAEGEFGSADKANEYRGEAITTLQGLMMLGDANDADARPHIEDAFGICVPLLVEAEHYQAAVDDADRYVETFSNGRYLSEIRRARSKARTKLAVSGVEVIEKADEPVASEPKIEETKEAPEKGTAPAGGTGENQ